MTLAGRVIVVTGAGRGIGRAHALALAAAGAAVVVNDLGVAADGAAPSATPAQTVADEVLAGGGDAIACHDDVSDEAGAGAIVAAALRRWGRLDGVVNNAGILRSGLLLRTTAADWRAVFDVHLVGTMLVTQAAAEHWRDEAKAGRTADARVVNTTSSAGLYGFVGEPAYSAAKAGVVGFTLTAAAELERYGVTVNAVAPAAATRLTAWAGEDTVMAPSLVSPLVVWLCGPASTGITGRVFEAGGGEVHVVEGWRRAARITHDATVGSDELGDQVRAAVATLAAPMPVTVPVPPPPPTPVAPL